jgi:hypothetical protein
VYKKASCLLHIYIEEEEEEEVVVLKERGRDGGWANPLLHAIVVILMATPT